MGRNKDKCNSQGGRRPCGSLPLAARHALQRPKPWGRSPQSRAGSPEGLCRLQPTDYHPQRSLQMWMTRRWRTGGEKGKPNSSLIGQKFFFLPSWKMWNVRILIKNEDKNRFILNKEIVEKYKIVEISKYYLKGNIPSTVDVLRAGK